MDANTVGASVRKRNKPVMQDQKCEVALESAKVRDAYIVPANVN